MVSTVMSPADRLRFGFAALIATIWTASIGVDFVSATYNPPPAIQAAFMAVVGYLFFFRKDDGKEDPA